MRDGEQRGNIVGCIRGQCCKLLIVWFQGAEETRDGLTGVIDTTSLRDGAIRRGPHHACTSPAQSRFGSKLACRFARHLILKVRPARWKGACLWRRTTLTQVRTPL